MPIKLPGTRQPNGSTEKIVKELIRIGEQYRLIAESTNFYRELRVNKVIADTIRHCNHMMGMSGSFKNGCLYREFGLAQFWSRGNGERVVCDHATPVRQLVTDHHAGTPIENLIFSPVVRISKGANDSLTKIGLAKKGHNRNHPLSRYAHIDLRITTHFGYEVNPATWTYNDHWSLVFKTHELSPLLKELNISELC